MRGIAEQDLLSAWEEALDQHPLDRVLTLLAAMPPAASRADLASLGVGERDARLLDLRERAFGPDLTAFAACPSCGQDLELRAHVAELRAASPVASVATAELEVEADGFAVRFRRVDSRDLAAVVGARDPATARAAFLARIVLEARRGGETIAAVALPEKALAAVEARLAELEAPADLLFDLTCPACGATWQAPFDAGAYLWTEVDVWARRLLATVDTLARTYGWREADVMALGPRRRRLYLELAEA